MPTVDKIKAPRLTTVATTPHSPTTGATSLSDGILGKARSVSKLQQSPVKVLLYGQNRTGKTTLACQFPKPLLLVSFEPTSSGGAESVRRVKDVNYLKEGQDFSGVEGAVQLARELSSNPRAYATVVVDSATSLQDVVLRELMGTEEAPLQMSWGLVQGDQYRMRSERTREVLWEFLKLPCNVVVTAKEKDHNPPKEDKVNERTGKVQPDMRAKFLRGLQTESFVAADLGGATTGWVQDACDCICRLYLEPEIIEEEQQVEGTTQRMPVATGKFIRVLRTGYHPNYAAGIRSCTPDKVPDTVERPSAEKLLKIIRGD